MSKTTQKSPELSKQDITLIEAALYVAGHPLDLKTLGSIIKTRSKRKTQQLARALTKKYNEHGGALEILELEDNRFVLQLKQEYTRRVRRLAMRPILKDGALKTLSYVAYRQPIPQTQVIKVRGPHAYNHLKQMEEMGVITRKQEGRTKIIQTTEFFSDYFGLSSNLLIMKRQLKNKFDEFLKLNTH